MIKEVTVRKAGGSVTVVVPAAMAERLDIRPGTRLWIAESPGGLLLTKDGDQFSDLMEQLTKGTESYAQALLALERR